MFSSIIAICAGASLGSLVRWACNQLLNSIFPPLPLGTLAVNLAGSLLMGVALGFFAFHPLAAQWRLMVITGFLGSLTTFSAFAGEMSALIIAGRFWLCACGVFLHVAGSICMVFLGLWLFDLFRTLFIVQN